MNQFDFVPSIIEYFINQVNEYLDDIFNKTPFDYIRIYLRRSSDTVNIKSNLDDILESTNPLVYIPMITVELNVSGSMVLHYKYYCDMLSKNKYYKKMLGYTDDNKNNLTIILYNDIDRVEAKCSLIQKAKLKIFNSDGKGDGFIEPNDDVKKLIYKANDEAYLKKYREIKKEINQYIKRATDIQSALDKFLSELTPEQRLRCELDDGDTK